MLSFMKCKHATKGGYLSQVGLQAVLSIGGFRNTVREVYVDTVELVPHLVGRGVQQDFDLVPELVGGGAVALGVQDVVVCEFRPRVREGKSARKHCGQELVAAVILWLILFFFSQCEL